MELNDLIQRIQNANETDAIEIDEAAAHFALRMTWLNVETLDEAFLFFASMNVLNAYVKKKDAGDNFFKRYEFKHDIVRVLEHLILYPIKNVSFYLDKDVTYIDLLGLQFSFHHLPLTAISKEYQTSDINLPFEWKGIRLQPIATLILDEAIKMASPSLKTRIQPIDPVRVFARLGHPIRLRMFLALITQDLNRDALATHCGIEPSKLNYHMKFLLDLRLVERRRNQKATLYRVNPIALGQLSSLIPRHPRRLKPIV